MLFVKKGGVGSSPARLKVTIRKSGRAVKCAGLENQSTCKRTGGSNPSSSATVNPRYLGF